MNRTFTQLERSLVEAKLRMDKLEQKSKQYTRIIKRMETEINVVEETIYIILSQMDNLAQEQKQKDLNSLIE
jgi:SMC interacting uncharacterized protein involved in chromosome segregation